MSRYKTNPTGKDGKPRKMIRIQTVFHSMAKLASILDGVFLEDYVAELIEADFKERHWDVYEKRFQDSVLKTKQQSDFTYLIGDVNADNEYKIGRSNNVLTRLYQIQKDQERPGAFIISFTKGDIEKPLHKKLGENRIEGEWFKLDENKVADILQVFSAL